MKAIVGGLYVIAGAIMVSTSEAIQMAFPHYFDGSVIALGLAGVALGLYGLYKGFVPEERTKD